MAKKKTTVPPEEEQVPGIDGAMSASPKDESGSEGLLPAGEPLDTTGEAGGGDSTPPNVSSEDTTPPDDADPLLLGDAEIPEEGEKSMGDTAAETGEETVSGEGAAEPQYEDLLRELGNSTPLKVAKTMHSC